MSSSKPHNYVDFHAKISKKVAELTVVVHMLFKRNHEKEVEHEYFKLIAERQLEKIEEQHKQKLAWLEKQLDEQETYRAKVEYQLGDMSDLREKIVELEQTIDGTRQQVVAKDELLSIANLEIDVLKQKIQSYEEDLESANEKKEVKNLDAAILRPAADQDRLSKSATQLHMPTSSHEKRNGELETIVRKLEGELARLKRDHENELTRKYSEKIALQNKIDAYNASLSQEIEELKHTLNTLSSKQLEDQKKITDITKEKKKIEEDLRRSEAEKKQLQRDSKLLKDQLKNSIKSNQLSKKNLMAFRDVISHSSPKQTFHQPVSIFTSC